MTALPNGLVIYPGATGAAGVALNDNFTALDPLIAGIEYDTSPKLGGDLDTNSFNIICDDAHGILDDSENQLLLFTKVASAVNYVDLSNAATGDSPKIEAVGDDTNINLLLEGKGTGVVELQKDTSGLSPVPTLRLTGNGYTDFNEGQYIGFRDSNAGTDFVKLGIDAEAGNFGAFCIDTDNGSNVFRHIFCSAIEEYTQIGGDPGGASGYDSVRLKVVGLDGVATTATQPSGAVTLFQNNIATSTDAFILVQSGDKAEAGILFGDDVGYVGFVKYDNNANNLLLGAKNDTILTLDGVGSDVNNFKLTSAATGNGPIFEVIGSDTNIDINLTPKGTGTIIINSLPTSNPGVTGALWNDSGTVKVA